MAFKVVMTPTRPNYPFKIEREILEPIEAEVVEVHWENEAQYLSVAADADAIVQGRGVDLTASIINQLTKAKAVMNGAVGLDRIDIEAATARGIAVINVPDVWINEVADHAMLLLLAVARKLPYAKHMAAGGRWPQVHPGLPPVPRLQGKTLGLISFGAIARNVAKRAQAFGINVISHDPFVTPEQMEALGVGSRTLEQLLSESDFVSAHAPLTKGTFHLMSDAQFALMKPTAYFINTGRGRVVDEPALIRALNEGKIRAAGLDVLEAEPPDPANPLLSMDNVIVTPHTAFYSDEAFQASRVRVGEEIKAVLTGKRPRTCANPSVLEGLGLK